MKITKNLQMKLTFFVFTLLVVLAFSGIVSARAVVDDSPLVLESGEKFNGDTPIQNAIDDEDTLNGHHIQIQAGEFIEQVTINKDLNISGVTGDPTDTSIGYDTENGVIIVPSGVSVVLENIHIWTFDENMDPLNNNGQITLINCLLNGVYYENHVFGTVETMGTKTMGTTELMASGSPEEEFVVELASAPEGDAVTGDDATGTTKNSTETTETSGTETSVLTETNNTTEDPTTEDTNIPLTSLASGMLMLMGGTVISKRE